MTLVELLLCYMTIAYVLSWFIGGEGKASRALNWFFTSTFWLCSGIILILEPELWWLITLAFIVTLIAIIRTS